MYPIERCINIFKGYVKNPYRPEASTVERYIANEAIEFYTTYMLEVDATGYRGRGMKEGKKAKAHEV